MRPVRHSALPSPAVPASTSLREIGHALLLVALAVLPALATAGEEAGGPDPRALQTQIASSRLEADKAVQVEGVFLALGPAFLDMERGVLVPATTVGSQPYEMAFVGKARLSLEPPDEIEADQLELFTGSESLDVEIREGILVLTEKAQVDLLLMRPPASDGAAEAVSRAGAIYENWRGGTERRMLGMESAILQASVGDEAFRDYVAFWAGDSDLGSFHFLVDPAEHEQVILGQFVPDDLSSKERRKLERETDRGRRQGRYVDFALEDLGSFDTWLSTTLPDQDGQAAPGHPGFDEETYTLDVEIAKISQRLTGRAKITAVAVGTDRKVLRLELSRDLEVRRILDRDGNELFFTRHGTHLTIPLGAPVRPGYTATVTVEFEGSPLEQLSGQRWVLRNTLFWYPQVSLYSKATYDMRFTWPGNLDLVASGKKVEEGTAGKGMRWERRVQEFPVSAVSFELGEFRIDEELLGDLRVRFAFPNDFARRRETRELDHIKQAVLDPLEFFQGVYGDLPMEEMTVTFVDRNYSQGLFGFITMSTAASVNHGWWHRLIRRDPRTTFAHEVAHQWWGHLVGWESYRDQWISEAMANYSAILYARKKLNMSGDYLTGSLTRWPTQLYLTTKDGRSFESLGPVVLGSRLHSSRAPGAHIPVVYLKGAMVMDMLSRFFRNEDLFPVLLKRLVERAYNELISTEDFLGHLARMSNTDLDWFSQQYIYGTGVPQIRYGYEFKELDGGEWLIEGWARQEVDHRYRFKIIRRPDGRLDVGREAVEVTTPENSQLVTPFQVMMEMEEGEGKRKTTYDGVDRRVRKEQILTASGQGNGTDMGRTEEGIPSATPPPDPAQGGGDGIITQVWDHDLNSLPSAVTDDNGNRTEYAYDNLDRRIQVTAGLCTPPALADRCDPPTSTQYQYDPDDNRIQVIDENGSVVDTLHDAVNRPRFHFVTPATGVAGTSLQLFEYDGAGRLTRALDDNNPLNTADDANVTFIYDSLDRILEQAQSIGPLSGRVVSQGWRAENLRSSLIYPDDRELQFSHDGLDRVSGFEDVLLTPADTLARTYIGRQRQAMDVVYPILSNHRITMLDPAATADVWYDGERRAIQVEHLRPDDSRIVGLGAAYNRTDRRVFESKLHDTSNHEAYAHDSAYRLTQFQRPVSGALPPQQSAWSLDGPGNWKQVDTQAREHSSFNEIIALLDVTGPVPLDSDDNGNLIDDGQHLYGYDAFNRLISVVRKADGAALGAYAYDALGRRVRTVLAGGTLGPAGSRHFYHGLSRVIEERDGSDDLVQQYVRGASGELLVLSRDLDGDGNARGTADQQLFFHQGMFGSVFAISEGGAVVEGYQQEAYGLPVTYVPGGNGVVDFGGDDLITLGSEGAVGNPYRWRGARFDSESGLYLFQDRHYSPILGRFLQREASAGAHNWYAISGGSQSGAAAPYRPGRLTPRPRNSGPSTSVVVGPGGEEIAPDAYGRVKVQFSWDRSGEKDEGSTCWIQVSQQEAYPAWPRLWIPDVDDEVVVSLDEGDPDGPIITGNLPAPPDPGSGPAAVEVVNPGGMAGRLHGARVYLMPLPFDYFLDTWPAAPGIKTRSPYYNEMRFEDLAGEENIDGLATPMPPGLHPGPGARSWESERVPVTSLVGRQDLRLRFDFATAGEMCVAPGGP